MGGVGGYRLRPELAIWVTVTDVHFAMLPKKVC